MSIEPQCMYCNAHDKFRCKTQEEANKCPAHARFPNPEPQVKIVTIADIDAAIETLTRLKKQIGV